MAINAEQLNIILSARDKEFTKAMERSQKRVEQFASKSQKGLSSVGKSFDGLGSIAKRLLPILAGAFSIQKIAGIINTAAEVEKLASVAGVSVERFQELSFAAKSFGVEQEKLADILKDVNDKFGDYIQTGAGPLADFFENIAPKIGVTAEQFKGLSSEQVLGLYVSSLEKANVSQAEMTFYMEAIASDATLLTRAFANNGSELDRLTQKARDMGLVVRSDVIANMKEAKSEIEAASAVIDAELASALQNILPFIVSAAQGIADLTDIVREFFQVSANGGKTPIMNREELIAAAEDYKKFQKEYAAVQRAQNKLRAMDAQEAAGGGYDMAYEAQVMLELAAAQDALAKAKERSAAADQAASNFEGMMYGRRDAIVAAAKELELAKQTTDERKRAAIEEERIAFIKRAMSAAEAKHGGTVPDVVATGIKTLADAYAQLKIQTLEAEAAAAKNNKTMSEAERKRLAEIEAIEKYKEALSGLGVNMSEFEAISNTIQSSMEDAFMGIVDGTMTAKDAFKSMASSVIKELFRVLVIQRLVGRFAGPGAAGSGILGAIGGSLGIGAASGRSVQAGQPITVGEHGREPFVPSQNGRILSVGQAKSAVAGGGQGVTVYQTINVSTGVAQTVRSEIKAMMPQIADNTKAAVLDAKLRGGAYGRAF